MTELDYIIDVHRRERRAAQDAWDLCVIFMFAIGYLIYSSVF